VEIGNIQIPNEDAQDDERAEQDIVTGEKAWSGLADHQGQSK
jgi:hypothetical protein